MVERKTGQKVTTIKFDDLSHLIEVVASTQDVAWGSERQRQRARLSIGGMAKDGFKVRNIQPIGGAAVESDKVAVNFQISREEVAQIGEAFAQADVGVALRHITPQQRCQRTARMGAARDR